jgi:osmotically-inducible protein OsmY
MKTQRSLKQMILVPAFLLATGFSAAVFAQNASAADESAVVSQVQAALSQDASLKGAQVKVISKNGRIVLFGDATGAQAAAAYRDAAGVSGSMQVHNFISATDING